MKKATIEQEQDVVYNVSPELDNSFYISSEGYEQHERLARIRNWAGMAMQGILTDRNLGSFGEVAQWSFNYANAMEAEYQKQINKEES